MTYPLQTASALRYLGVSDDVSVTATDDSTCLVDWGGVEPITPETIIAVLASAECQTWLAEHGGDALLTRRRQLRDMVADTSQPIHAVLLAVQKLLIDATQKEVLLPAEANALSDLYPQWQSGVTYAVDDLCAYRLHLYRVIQAHTSQADWTPDVVPALFARYYEPNVIPDWVQPTGGHDAYTLGARVKHNGKTWESTVDNNVWEPGVYGWEDV